MNWVFRVFLPTPWAPSIATEKNSGSLFKSPISSLISKGWEEWKLAPLTLLPAELMLVVLLRRILSPLFTIPDFVIRKERTLSKSKGLSPFKYTFPAYCSSVVHFGGLAAEKWTSPASTELPSSSCAYERHCPRSASPDALSKELIPFFSACIECFPLKYCSNKCAVGLAGLLRRLTRERIAIPLIPSYYLQNASKVSTHIDDCFVQQTEWLMTERKTRSLIMVIDLMFALTSRELKSHAYAKIKALTSFANW